MTVPFADAVRILGSFLEVRNYHGYLLTNIKVFMTGKWTYLAQNALHVTHRASFESDAIFTSAERFLPGGDSTLKMISAWERIISARNNVYELVSYCQSH